MPGRRKVPYERIQEKANKGHYELVEPLDFLILDKLMDEGTTFANLYEIGVQVSEIVKAFDHQLGPDAIGGRLNSMKHQGLARMVRVMGKKQNTAWQRTSKGREMLDKWKEAQNGSA